MNFCNTVEYDDEEDCYVQSFGTQILKHKAYYLYLYFDSKKTDFNNAKRYLTHFTKNFDNHFNEKNINLFKETRCGIILEFKIYGHCDYHSLINNLREDNFCKVLK